MAAPRLIIDTNCLSRWADRSTRYPRTIERLDAEVVAHGWLFVSNVTLYEIERGLRRLELQGQPSAKVRAFERVRELVKGVGLDVPEVWDAAVELWAQGRAPGRGVVIEDPDLFIASTARANGMRLVTGDRKLVHNLERLDFPEHLLELLED